MSIGNAFFVALFKVIYAVLNFYWYAVIIGAVLSWLIAFDVVNPYNRTVRAVADFLARLTEPLLKPIRRVLPNMGGVDLSPLILIFIIYFIESFVGYLAFSVQRGML